MNRAACNEFEFRLIPWLFWRLRHRIGPDGWLALTRTELTRAALWNRKGGISRFEFYCRVWPGWVQRGIGREIKRPGKPPFLAIRKPTRQEVQARYRDLERLWKDANASYQDSKSADYLKPEVFDSLERIKAECRVLRMEYRAWIEEDIARNAAAAK